MSDNKDNPPPSDDGKGTPELKKPDGFDADAIGKQVDSYTDEEQRTKFIGGAEQVYKANAEAKESRLKADANKQELDKLKKEIEDKTKQGLAENEEFKKLYELEQEKNNSMRAGFDTYKKFHDDQIEIINTKIIEMEATLSTELKDAYEVFKENDGISPSDKLKFLSKVSKKEGIEVDGKQSLGGGAVDFNKMTLTEKGEYFKKHGKLATLQKT